MTAITGTIRPVTPSELSDTTRSLSEWMKTSSDYTLQQTFPQVYRPDGEANLFGLFDDGRILSHAAVEKVHLIGPQGAFRAGLIGAVATDPEVRGRGLASRLLADVISWCRSQSLDAAILWSGQRSFYERLGFRPAGRQEEALIRTQPGSPAPGIRPAGLGDIVSILELHDAKPYRVERDLHNMALLLSVPGMWTMVLERNADIVAYACYGKGADFSNWWHEMGGTDHDVGTLLCGAMKSMGHEQAMVLLPPYRTRLKGFLGSSLISARECYCALRLDLTPAGRRNFFVDGLDSI